jgi:hypothetical protein
MTFARVMIRDDYTSFNDQPFRNEFSAADKLVIANLPGKENACVP